MNDILDALRATRSKNTPLLPSTPDAPGIRAAMALSAPLEQHLRGLAHVLLVEPFRDTTLSRGEREVLASLVSRSNACCFCADSHAAFANTCACAEGWDATSLLAQDDDGSERSRRIGALADIAEYVRAELTAPSEEAIARAREAGANEDDIHLTILIASAFSMFNRMVEGLRAVTPADTGAHAESAAHVATHGYTMPSTHKLTR